MYIHLGEQISINDTTVIGVFDIENTTIGPDTRAYLSRLEKEGKDCMLVADCLLTAELLDRLRLRGYTVSRSGIFRYRPWERILLTRRDQRCGGCGHNCLLENPGCGVGRDKAARQKASLNR